jgi:hypothetical protein
MLILPVKESESGKAGQIGKLYGFAQFRHAARGGFSGLIISRNILEQNKGKGLVGGPVIDPVKRKRIIDFSRPPAIGAGNQ